MLECKLPQILHRAGQSNYVSLDSNSVQDRLETTHSLLNALEVNLDPRTGDSDCDTVNRRGLMSSLLWAGKQVVARLERLTAICGDKSLRLVIEQRHKHWGPLRKAEV